MELINLHPKLAAVGNNWKNPEDNSNSHHSIGCSKTKKTGELSDVMARRSDDTTPKMSDHGITRRQGSLHGRM
jgi:hypothetical protein